MYIASPKVSQILRVKVLSIWDAGGVSMLRHLIKEEVINKDNDTENEISQFSVRATI